MGIPLPSNEELADVVRAYEEHGSTRAGAEALGMSKSTFHRHLTLASQRGLNGFQPVLPGFRVSRTSHSFDADGNLKAEHIQQKPELGEVFEMPAGHVAKGVSTLVDPDGRVLQQWIKTKLDDTTPLLTEALKHAFETYEGKSELIAPPRHTDKQLCTVYPIADQHNGLLAWGRETGESYDLKIGEARLRTTAKRLVSQSPNSALGIILNLGDWQHTDDQKNMTPRSGNILDVDSRYFKILTAGVRLMQDVVELALQKHETVIVVNIPGNHDPHASIALTVALAAFYHNNPRVRVIDEPGDWWFFRFGQTLMGATHGHRCKPDRMAMAMATQCREEWGKTKYHWMMFGHIHHETVKEVGDVRCESFQTLAAKDAHAHASGYVSGQSLVSITLHEEDGEIGRNVVKLAPQYKGATK
jgi:predicted phosphodiesterase